MSTILIVDDELFGRETVSAILDGQGYQLEMARNGEEALEVAEHLLPDLILLDVMMPYMDGFEVCRRLRANPRLHEVPILILTALDDRQALLLGIASGADDYLTKPLDREELRARVRTITRLNRYRTLLQQRENLKAMARRVIQAQEQERLRISREIHDDIGQALTAHQLGLEGMRDAIAEKDSALHKTLQVLIDETSQTFAKLRLLAQDLRPPLLDTFGVKQALKVYCNDFSRRSGLPVIYEEDGDIPDFADTVGVTLYRVLQESLSNIARHAKANQVWVSINVDPEEIALTVQDDGKGISNKDLARKGIGLQGMRERVTLTGGTFNLRTVPNQGTVISVRFPLKADEMLALSEAT